MMEDKKELQEQELNEVSGGAGGKYVCTYCGKSFSNMLKAQQHTQICDMRPMAEKESPLKPQKSGKLLKENHWG